jgi:DNA-binding response OmpR family regulator
MKILIVEDNAELAWLLAERLKAEGYELCTAACGAAGIKAALSFLPDLILLDYNLGDMSGRDVAVALGNTRKTSGIPFLVLSAHGADPMLARGFGKFPNCRGAMSKVLSTREVVTAVQRALPCARKPAAAPEAAAPAPAGKPAQPGRARLRGKLARLIVSTPVYRLLKKRKKKKP